MGTHQRVHRPSRESDLTLVGAHQGMMKGKDTMSASSNEDFKAQDQLDRSIKSNKDEPILTAANKLLNELKTAYTQILHEKDEQIVQLKDEVSDLKTLVRVLESENERLKGIR